MINLRIHTEFHFDFSDRGFGRLNDIVERVKALGQTAACITDATTFGHVNWHAKCRAAGINPLLGAEVRVPNDEGGLARLSLIARNNAGLEEMYWLTSRSISEEVTLDDLLKSSTDVIKLSGTLSIAARGIAAKNRKAWYADVSPSTPGDLRASKEASGLPLLAVSENRYPVMEQRAAFSLFGGAVEGYAQHILSEREARVHIKGLPDSAYTISDAIAKGCKVDLPKAVNMKVKGDIEKMCRAAIKDRLGRWTRRYEERLRREVDLIREKKFEDYFLIISDMCIYAKKHMVVGPARGSSAGSLVCFLLYITDVDPIVHGLMFERFIDVTRADLPDIDLDFPDHKRHMVIEYLQKKYGAENVAKIGTVLTLQPKSILRLVSKRLNIPQWEFQQLLDVMVERASGDSRGELCLLDTLEGMDAGKSVIAKFPQVRTATVLEGHANTSGTHAAGVIVCAAPVHNYCSVDERSGTAQIDKHDAEKLNLLKIDILGLRTLSVLEHTLEQIPAKRRPDLNKIPLDDPAAFAIFNEQRWAGIFQFEGDALQMLQKTIKMQEFSDIVAITALGRPGPLNSGGGQEWCDRRMGRANRLDLHELCSEFTQETYGIIVYQEQVMSIARKVGQLSWEDVTEIRKTMAKSKGEEFFNQFWEKFLKGALAQGLTKDAAHHVWTHLSTMGSWAFNKSHAASYGLISYWCAYLKAHFPLEFAAATLRHTKGEEQTIQILRELTEEGISFTSFDLKTSTENWQVIKGKLTGGFINLKGIGDATARELVAARDSKEGLSAKQLAKIDAAERLYVDIYPAGELYGGLYDDPQACGFRGITRLWTMRELDVVKLSGDYPSEFYFIGRLADKVPRDLNEYVFQVKRVQEGRPKLLTKDSAYMNMVIEDDTGKIGMTIGANMYEEVGRSITETGVVGKSWYMFRGRFNKLRRINVTWSKDITATPFPRKAKRRAA